MRENLSSRFFFGGLAIACLGLLLTGFYLEYFRGIEPCSLCILQRIAFAAIGLVSLLGLIAGKAFYFDKISASAVVFFSIAGSGIAGYQVWLQYLPADDRPQCSASLGYLMDIFPWHTALQKVFLEPGDCAEVSWKFLGLSIPEWSLLCFLVLFFASLCYLLRRKKIRVGI